MTVWGRNASGWQSESLYNWWSVGRSVGRSVSQSVSQSVSTGVETYEFSRHGASSLKIRRVCLFLVILSLSDVTIQKVRLFRVCTICNICSIYDMYKIPCHSRPCRAHHAVIRSILFYNDTWVTWTVVGLNATYTFCARLRLVLYCEQLHSCDFGWLLFAAEVISTYVMLKATCSSQVGVRLRKFPMVQKALFCRRCNVKRYASTANSQAGQALVITDLMRALWRFHLIVALKRLFFKSGVGVGTNKCSEGLGETHRSVML
jgi:hypothetical protein